jgi:phospholipase/carboxylesterase
MLSGPSRPAASGTTQQLIIFLHGLGADGADLIDLAEPFARALPNAAFFAPNAPFACDMAPMGYQWFSLQSRDEETMLRGMAEAAPALNATIDAQLKLHGLQDKELALVGFSQGTMMALHVGLRRAKPCAAIVGYSGAFVGGASALPESIVRPPVCLIHGDADMVVPFAASHMAERDLLSLNVPVALHRRPGLGHGIDPEGVQCGINWLKQHGESLA